MPATVTREFMFKQMEDNNLPYYQVFGADRTVISDNQTISDLQESKTALEEVLNAVMDTSVIVTLSKKTRKEIGAGGSIKAGYREYKIILRASTGVNGIGSPGIVQELMNENSILKDKLHDKDIQSIKDDFQRQIDDLKKVDPFESKALEAIAGLLMPNNKPVAGVAIAGNPTDTVDINQVERQRKLKSAITRLAAVDPNLEESMTKFADWAEKNPDKYKLMLATL